LHVGGIGWLLKAEGGPNRRGESRALAEKKFSLDRLLSQQEEKRERRERLAQESENKNETGNVAKRTGRLIHPRKRKKYQWEGSHRGERRRTQEADLSPKHVVVFIAEVATELSIRKGGDTAGGVI